MFSKREKLELLVLTEIKMKENRAVSWCGINLILGGVHNIKRVWEGMAIFMNDVWHSAWLALDVLVLESYGLCSSSQWLNSVLALLKEMLKKGRGFEMTWTGLWTEG